MILLLVLLWSYLNRSLNLFLIVDYLVIEYISWWVYPIQWNFVFITDEIEIDFVFYQILLELF